LEPDPNAEIHPDPGENPITADPATDPAEKVSSAATDAAATDAAAAAADAAAGDAAPNPLGADPGEPPSIRQQLGATVEAVKRLVRAHIGLARAEAGEIAGEVRRMVALVGLAIGAVVAVGLLLAVGLPLFLGEWLFGSIGWGVLLGAVLLVDLAVAAALLALDVGGSRVGRDFVIAAVIGTALGVVLGFDLTHRAWTSLGESVVPNLDPGTRPLIVAVVTLAIIGGLLGLAAGFRGGGVSIGGLFAGALGGAILGVITAASIPPTVGAALGVLVALLAWPVLSGRAVIAGGIDGEAIKQRFMPDQTIEMTKETIEWVRQRTPLVPKS
jgi:hypothetical protein